MNLHREFHTTTDDSDQALINFDQIIVRQGDIKSLRALLLPIVRAAYAERRSRDSFFAAGLFAEPEWDILLYLFAVALENGQATTGQVCQASGVANTTALRRIDNLEAARLIERESSVSDGRVNYLVLTRFGFESMAAYFTRRGEAGLCPTLWQDANDRVVPAMPAQLRPARKARRRFSRQVRMQAVRAVRDSGQSVAQVAAELGVRANMVRKWLKEFDADPTSAFRVRSAGRARINPRPLVSAGLR